MAATLGVGHAGGQTVVDLAGSAHSGDGVMDCVAKPALGLGVGVAGGSVFLGPALPAVAVQAVEVQSKWLNERPFSRQPDGG